MIKLVLTFKRKKGMDIQAFRDYRRNVHAPMLFAIPEAQHIRRFVVSYPVYPLTRDEPKFDAMVEAWFDSDAEMNALFHSNNFETKVDPDHENFIDISSIERVVTEETVVFE